MSKKPREQVFHVGMNVISPEAKCRRQGLIVWIRISLAADNAISIPNRRDLAYCQAVD